MKKHIFGLSLSLLFVITHTSFAQMLPVDSIDRIIAVVDEDVVLQSELDRAVTMVQTQYAKNPQQLPPQNILQRQVLERLIMQKLQLARADSTGVKVADAEIDQALAQIAKQNNIEVSQLRVAIQNQGLSFEQFRKNIRDELVIQHLRQRVVQSHVQISDAEADNLIKAGGIGSTQLHLAHILIAVPEAASPEQIDAARKKADDIKHQIDEGLDFSAAAIRYSDASNALEGGDIGWRGTNELPSAFTDVVSRMNIGEVMPPLRGPSGFNILKLLDKRDNSQQLVTEVHARHIMVKITELNSEEQAEKHIHDIHQRIVAGEDFSKLAKEFSEDDASANLGGDMGWFQPQSYGSKVTEVLKGLKDNELSTPFKTESGWHLLQLLGTRTQDKTVDMQREQAKQILFNRKAEEEYENFLRQIHSEAYIDIRLPGANNDAKPNAS